jgi:GNAT superfamily N-acetyltransferase
VTVSHHVRRATDADRPHVLALLAELLPGADLARRWAWLYRGGPAGPALTWLAFDAASGEPAGCTSFFPRRVVVDGRDALGALGGDGFVRPRFRRRGIGASLHRASRAAMRECGIDVMFGTPMPANATPLGAAGARDVTRTVAMVRPLDVGAYGAPAALAAALRPLLAPAGSPARLEPAVPHDPRVDAVWAAAAPGLGIGTARDAAFYTWRFLASPTRRQRAHVVVGPGGPIGSVALELVDRRLHVVDVVAVPGAFARVLRAVLVYARGLDGVVMKLAEGAARRLAPWRSGFVPRDRSKPLNVLLPEGAPDGGAFHDPARWYFTWADSDQDAL